MKSNRTFPLKVSFFTVGKGTVELRARLVPHCDFGETGNPVAPIAVNTLKGMKPMNIPSRVLLDHRLTVNLKTAKQLGIDAIPIF